MSEGRRLINGPPSRPGKACLDFLDRYTSQCCDASCVKPHLANNCPYQWLLILFLFLGNGSLGQNLHLGTKLHASQKQNFSLAAACGARRQLSRTFTRCTCTEIPPCCKPRCVQQPQQPKEWGSSCCPQLPSCCCQGEPPASWDGGAGTDRTGQTICQDSKHDRRG